MADIFGELLRTKTAGGASSGGSKDHSDHFADGVDAVLEGLATIQVALNSESTRDGTTFT